MALYFLSYDLRNKRDYQPLYDEFKKFNAVRMLESCWCFKRINTNAKGLRDYFKKFVDGDDGASSRSRWSSSMGWFEF